MSAEKNDVNSTYRNLEKDLNQVPWRPQVGGGLIKGLLHYYYKGQGRKQRRVQDTGPSDQNWEFLPLLDLER